MKLLFALAAGALGYCYYRGSQLPRASLRKEELHRWEGEGGNVPAVATPSPVVGPAPSFPAGEGGMRH